MGHLQSNQEEADTNIILHALDATTDGVTELHIHSQDTDVLVLAIRRYPELCVNTSFVTREGSRRVIDLKSIVEALGPVKTAALLAFHALLFIFHDEIGASVALSSERLPPTSEVKSSNPVFEHLIIQARGKSWSTLC